MDAVVVAAARAHFVTVAGAVVRLVETMTEKETQTGTRDAILVETEIEVVGVETGMETEIEEAMADAVVMIAAIITPVATMTDVTIVTTMDETAEALDMTVKMTEDATMIEIIEVETAATTAVVVMTATMRITLLALCTTIWHSNTRASKCA
jgi:hypothetical protein